MKKILLLLSFLSVSVFADDYPLFPIMYDASSLYKQAFLGGGSALLDGALGQGVNPATVQAWHRVHRKGIDIGGGYFGGKDSQQRYGGGASANLTQKDIIAAEFLSYKSNTHEPTTPLIRGTFTWATLLKDDGEEGGLNLGINASYYNSTAMYSASDSLGVTTYELRDSNWVATDSSKYISDVKFIDRRYNSISGDIGLFQMDEIKGQSFSLVFENILGYTWYKKTPQEIIKTEYIIDSLTGDTTGRIDSLAYNKGVEVEDNGVLKGKYKSILIGGASSIPLADGKLMLMIPLDFRFYGFFDKWLRDNEEYKNRLAIHTGVELYLGPVFSGRLGYSWVYTDLHTRDDGNLDPHPTHRISGGASLNIEFIIVEAAWSKDSWGLGAQFVF